MKTAIYVSGILISDAVRKSSDMSSFYSDGTCTFLGILFFVFATMDIIELFKPA